MSRELEIATELSCPFDSHSHDSIDDGGDEVERSNGFRFHPPLYIQRYKWAIDHLREFENVKHLVDMGCAEGKFLQRARFGLPHVRKMTGIDILDECCTMAKTILNDERDESFFLERRPNPLTVNVMKGSIEEYDARLVDVDAVTLIEVIEHVHLDQLAQIVTNVFGNVRPRHVLVSTPNKEFNVVFDLPDDKTRHWDHKFEWTRREFEDWCTSVTTTYPDYSVVIGGCGAIDPELLVGDDVQYAKFAHVGPASQTAVFTRRATDAQSACSSQAMPYETVLSTTYAHDPSGRLRNTLRQLVIAHCNELIEKNNLEVVPGHPRVFYFDVQFIIDVALKDRTDLRVFVPNLSHIMAVLLEDRRFDFASNSQYASFADAMNAVPTANDIDRTSQVVYPTTAYNFIESVDLSIVSDMSDIGDDYDEAALDASETQWPSSSVDDAQPWGNSPPRCATMARLGEYFTDYCSMMEANAPFVIQRYRGVEFDHTQAASQL